MPEERVNEGLDITSLNYNIFEDNNKNILYLHQTDEDEDIGYTIFDKDYLFCDSGSIENRKNMSLDDIIEQISKQRKDTILILDSRQFKQSDLSIEKLIEKESERELLDRKMSNSFVITDRFGRYCSEFSKGEFSVSSSSDDAIYFSKEKAEELIDKLGFGWKCRDNQEFVDILKSNILHTNDTLESIKENLYHVYDPLTVLCKIPNEKAFVTEVDNNLLELQNAVGGNVEYINLDDSTVCIVNEDGKLMGLEPNITLYNSNLDYNNLNGVNFKPSDVLVGVVLVVGKTSNGDLVSLDNSQIELYGQRLDMISIKNKLQGITSRKEKALDSAQKQVKHNYIIDINKQR